MKVSFTICQNAVRFILMSLLLLYVLGELLALIIINSFVCFILSVTGKRPISGPVPVAWRSRSLINTQRVNRYVARDRRRLHVCFNEVT